MIHKSVYTIVLMCFAYCMAAEAQPSAFFPEKKSSTPSSTQEAGEKPGSVEKQDASTSDPIESFIQDKSLQSRIAQLMMVTLEGETRLLAGDVRFLKEVGPGGVLLSHALTVEAALSFVQGIRSFEMMMGAPLLIGANLYELTLPTRSLPSMHVQLPSLLSVVAAGNTDVTREYGSMLAMYAQSMGFNLHVGPSLDLSPSLDNMSGSLLALGTKSEEASEVARLLQESFKGSKVLFMPAGFPGGGANKEGRGAAVLTTSLPSLLLQDGKPYKAALEGGIEIIHVGNVFVPTIEPDSRSASLSQKVISGILREELQYNGVVVAGPMDDEAIRSQGDVVEAGLLSLQAGADMLMWKGNLLQPEKAIGRIVAAVAADELLEDRLNESVRRVLRLKSRMGISKVNDKGESKGKIGDMEELLAASVRVERNAATLIRNINNVLPLGKDASTPLGITGVTGVEEMYQILEKEMEPVLRQAITSASHVNDIERFEIERLTKNMRMLKTIVVILSDKVRMEGQIELVRALKKSGAKVIVIFLGHPKAAWRFQDADSILLSYCNPAASMQSIQALAPILLGRSPIVFLDLQQEMRMKKGEERLFDVREIIRAPAGSLPVSLNESYPAGLAAGYDPSGSIKHVEWEFDGKKERKEKVSHAFSSEGTHAVKVDVTDVYGTRHTREFRVQVDD